MTRSGAWGVTPGTGLASARAVGTRLPRSTAEAAGERAPCVSSPGQSASLQVQHFAGACRCVRIRTYRCIGHAGSAPSGAARACQVSPQVRNATQPEAPVRICHSRRRWIGHGDGNARRVTFRPKDGHGDPGTGSDVSVETARRGVTPGAGLHRTRRLGAVRHLQVRLPRTKRIRPCSSCGPGAPTRAECHQTRASCEYASLHVPIDRAHHGGTRLSCPFERPRRQRQPASEGRDSVREVGAPWTAGMLPSRPAW